MGRGPGRLGRAIGKVETGVSSRKYRMGGKDETNAEQKQSGQRRRHAEG